MPVGVRRKKGFFGGVIAEQFGAVFIGAAGIVVRNLCHSSAERQ